MSNFVLQRESSFGERLFGQAAVQVLNDQDGGRPLLFGTREDAEAYFLSKSGGESMASRLASVREANAYEEEKGVLQVNVGAPS